MSSSDAGQLPSPRDPFDSSASHLLPITPQPTPPGPIQKVGEISRAHLGVEHQANQTPVDHKASVEPTSTAAVVFRGALGIPDSSKATSKVQAGSAEDLQKQDDAAGRRYLATYKALHLGGKETPESRLIHSALLPVQKAIIFSPPTLNLELPLFEEIQHVLSRDFDLSRTPISSITLVSEPERRNRILRIELKNSENRVIFKESHPMREEGKTPNDEDMKASYDRFARDWAGLEFAGGLVKTNPLCPQCYGGSEEYRFILQQDLGKDQVTLANHLLEGEVSAAKGSLERYMTSLGRFHAAGHAKVGQYLEILHKINPEAPEISIEKSIEMSLGNLRAVLTLLNLPHPRGLEEEVRTVITSTSNPTGPFVTLIHGDPCPDNVFDYPDRLLLIDFEWASVGSALLDAAYPRMNMPSGWCAGQFPENLLDAAESIYRDEMEKLIPEAKDDKIYFEAYAEACAAHILNQSMCFIPRVFEKDDAWGIASVRSRVLSHLKTFINIAEKRETLPTLKSLATEIVALLERKWAESKPLDLYPAFTKKKLKEF